MKITEINNFWNKVIKTDTCWLWSAAKDKDGYGIFHCESKNRRAHRISWELSNGKIKNNLLVLHKCDNPTCINPSHLFLGTTKDNVNDRVKKGRSGFGVTSKIDYKKAIKIRELFSKGVNTRKELAYKFSIHRRTVSDIISNKSWVTSK